MCVVNVWWIECMDCLDVVWLLECVNLFFVIFFIFSCVGCDVVV